MSPAKKDDEPKIFDVKKTKFTPSATSKPIIVGHHPMMPDPMLHSRLETPPPESGDTPAKPSPEPSLPKTEAPASAIPPMASQPGHTINPEVAIPKLADAAPLAPTESSTVPAEDLKVKLPAGQAAHSRQRAGWIVLAGGILIILAIAIYLVIDSKVIKTSINLPFHVFKQPAVIAPVSGSTLANQSLAGISGSEIAATGKLPSGWTWYTNTDPAFKFAYPVAWKLTTDTVTKVTTVRLSQHETYPSFVKDSKYPNDPELDFSIYSTDPEPSTPSKGLDNTISGPDMKKLSVITVNKLPSALVESQFTSYDDSVQLSGCANLVCSFTVGSKFVVVDIETLGSQNGSDGHNLSQSSSIYKTQLEILKTFSF